MTTEFELIDRLRSRYGLARIGDDCAVLPGGRLSDLVVTADLLVEDVDFRTAWATPETIGAKALAVSLSDVAAMGATPVWSILCLAIPQVVWESDFVDRFYDGYMAVAGRFGVELAGGDISRSPSGIVIDSVAAGESPRGGAVRRSGARPGDALFVTGSLGGAAGGLRILESGPPQSEAAARLAERFLRPEPRVAEGLRIGSSATSMIDISDGLSSDLAHLCAAGGVGATIERNSLPIDPDLAALFPGSDTLALALDGGEDFELLFSAPPEAAGSFADLGVSRIGTVTSNRGVVELADNGSAVVLRPGGYRHF